MDYYTLQDEIRLEHFRKYIYQNIYPSLIKIERKRRVYLAVFLLFFLIYILLRLKFNAVILAEYFLLTSFFIIYMSYYNFIKNCISPLLLAFFGELNTTPRHKIDDSTRTFLSGLYLFEVCDSLDINDYINGEYKSKKINIYEIFLMNKINNTEEIYKKFLSGILINFNTKTPIESYIVIVNKKTKNIGYQYKWRSMYKYSTNDSIFDKKYDVYYSDINDVKKILTAQFIEKMKYITEQNEAISQIRVSIEYDNIQIFIPTNYNWLEIPLFKSLLNIKTYDKIITELLLIFIIIDEFSE